MAKRKGTKRQKDKQRYTKPTHKTFAKFLVKSAETDYINLTLN
jgi:hypothetical protein